MVGMGRVLIVIFGILGFILELVFDIAKVFFAILFGFFSFTSGMMVAAYAAEELDEE